MQIDEEKPWFLEVRNPRFMSEADLQDYDARRYKQRAFGSFALDDDDHDPFVEFDMLSERQEVSKEPVQRAKDRMTAALMRGDVSSMIRATSKRIKATKNRAKLKGIVTALDQVLAEPGLGLTPSHKKALLLVQKQAKMRLGESDLRGRLGRLLSERKVDMEAHLHVTKEATSLRYPGNGTHYEIRVTGNTFDIKADLKKLGLRFTKKLGEPAWRISAGWTMGNPGAFEGPRPGKSWGPKFEKMDEIAAKVKIVVDRHNASVREKNAATLGLAGYNVKEPGWDSAKEMYKWLSRIERQTDRLKRWGIEYGYDTPGSYDSRKAGVVVYFYGKTFAANHVFNNAGFRGAKNVSVGGKRQKFAWAMPAASFRKISQQVIQDIVAFLEKKDRQNEEIRLGLRKRLAEQRAAKKSLGQQRLGDERHRALGEYALPIEEAEAAKMRAKGYHFKLLLKTKPPLYVKTEKQANALLKDYPGAKIVKND